jgi:hypothetical protein
MVTKGIKYFPNHPDGRYTPTPPGATSVASAISFI